MDDDCRVVEWSPILGGSAHAFSTALLLSSRLCVFSCDTPAAAACAYFNPVDAGGGGGTMTSDNDRLTGMDGGDFSGLVLRDLAINKLISFMTLVCKL